MWRWVAALILGISVVLGLAACAGVPDNGSGRTVRDTPSVDQAAVAHPVQVTTEPAAGVTDASPNGPIRADVSEGVLAEVTLTGKDGTVVAGGISRDKHTWTAYEALGYNKSYTWSGTVVGTDGKPVPITGTFHTVAPKRTIGAHIDTVNGAVYGVAMPIVVNFSSRVRNKAAVQKALSVQTSIPVEGSWAWFSDTSVHWRPKEFWPENIKVTVNAKVYGVPFGGGAYGREDVSSSFSIGAKQTVQGDVRTHRLRVFKDDQLVYDFPVSFGLDSVLWRNTRSGIHVVMEKDPTYLMNNPRGDYQNVFVRWAVRISNNGEFIHALPETVWAQGRKNISHGCANLSTAYAQMYYDFAHIGDPVDIEGSNAKLGAVDGDFYDWTLDWNTYKSMSAVPN